MSDSANSIKMEKDLGETGQTGIDIRRGSIDDEMIAQDPDGAKLMAMGYAPQMKREFNPLQLIGAAFMVTASWLGVTGGFSTGVVIGGSVSIVYGLIIVAVMNIFIVTSLSELMSAMPNSGGQYYWAMKLAPKRLSRLSAFFTGLCNLAGGIVATAGSCTILGYMIMACAKLYHPNIQVHTWQVYLIGLALNISSCLVNVSGKSVARSLLIGMFINLFAWIAITITIPAASSSHTDAKFIFTSIENSSGWKSNGMAFLVALINANYSFGLIDTAVHLAEEVPEPEKNVPKTLYIIVAIGFFTAFPLAILLMYSLTDFDAVVGTDLGIPLLQLFYIALRQNKAGAVFMLFLIIVSYFFAMIALQAYQARICWAFSRDNGLPLSKYWSRVHPKLKVPIHAHCFCVVLVAILSLLCIASTTAFNSLAAGVIIFPSLSYILPVIYSLLPENRAVKGPFNLGLFGTISKCITVLFCVFVVVIYSFPYVMPAEASNMNYISAIFGVFMIYAAVDWTVRGRKHFTTVHIGSHE